MYVIEDDVEFFDILYLYIIRKEVEMYNIRVYDIV